MTAASEATALVQSWLSPALATDVRGRIIAANDALLRCLELEADQIVGTEFVAWVLHPAALAEFLRGEGHPCEFVFRSAGGGERYLELCISRRLAGDHLVLAAWDVTARHAVEQGLRDDIERFSDMISAGTGWFFEIDATLTRQRVFRRATKDGALAMVEQQNKWPDDTMDPTYDPEGYAEVVRRGHAREPSRNTVFRVPSHQVGGREVYLLGSSIPFYDKTGAYQGRRGVSIEVTRQVLAERALRRAQEHLVHAQQLAEIGSSEIDLETGTDTWSDQLFRIVGIEPRPLSPGKIHLLDFVHPDDRSTVEQALVIARSGKKPRPGEIRIVRADGEIRTIYNETDIECDTAGRPLRVLGIFRDVTEQRAAENRQREMEHQLVQAHKLEALGTLAGGVAHELNNALVPILGLTKMTIRRLPEGSREQTDLMTVLNAGEKARDLVKQIVAFSRKEMPERVEVDLAELVRNAMRLLRESLPQTMTLEERVELVPRIMGDPGQLPQIVINLVVNAVQATRDQKGVVIVEVARASGERLPQVPGQGSGAAVRISVTDHGSGMDKATLARVFEPFFTTKEVGAGAGLGLSVVHGIVTQHGGRIAVESHIGRGTRFDVYLPALMARE